jgi:hypothetical protein
MQSADVHSSKTEIQIKNVYFTKPSKLRFALCSLSALFVVGVKKALDL